MLRLTTVASKFVFLFFAARYLSLDEFGEYSLLAASIAYTLYIIGLDFYAFVIREVAGSKPAMQGNYILQQFKLYLLSYILFSLPLSYLFWSGLLAWHWCLAFYLILLSEHLSQELTRLIVALGHPLKANLVLFIRSAGWVLVVITVFLATPSLGTVKLILTTWFLASTLSMVVGLRMLNQVPWRNILRQPFDKHWVFRGLRISAQFLISTLALRFIFIADRYYIQLTDGIEMVGVYALYASFGTALIMFIDAGVVQFVYPRLLAATRDNNYAAFRILMTRFLTQITTLILAMLATLAFTLEHVLQLLDKPEYLSHTASFWWIVAGYSLMALSYIPHYALYALGRDKTLLVSHVLPFLTFILVLVATETESGMKTIGSALVCAFTLSLVIKSMGLVGPWKAFMTTSKKGREYV